MEASKTTEPTIEWREISYRFLSFWLFARMAELDVGQGLRSSKRRGASISLGYAKETGRRGRGIRIPRLFHNKNYICPFIGVCSKVLSSKHFENVPACRLS